MVRRALSGDTYTSIAEWLDDTGVSTVHGGPWSQTSVRTALSSPALKGRYLNAAGEVTHKFTDCLMSAAEWKQLQASLDRRPQRRGMITAETALLTSVIFCDRCKGAMYRTKSRKKRKDGTVREWFYYRCGGTDRRRSDCRNMVSVEDADAWVHSWFTETGAFAPVEIVETIVTPGDDHAEEIAELEAEIKELNLDSPDYDQRHATLRRERSRLLAMPSEPARTLERPTGKRVGDVWRSLDDEQRRRFLLAGSTRVFCMSNAAMRRAGNEMIYITGNPNRLTEALRNLTDD
jgi:Recombinase zinc beta ribbon domain/Recombinase